MQPHNRKPRLLINHSFLSLLSLLIAFLTILWLAYVKFSAGQPPHVQILNPLWLTLEDNFQWPGLIGIAVAVLALIQPSRNRILSLLAIILIILAYIFLFPPLNFA